MDAADAGLLIQAIVADVDRAAKKIIQAAKDLGHLDVNLAKLDDWAGDTGTGARITAVRLLMAARREQCDDLAVAVLHLGQKCQEILNNER